MKQTTRTVGRTLVQAATSKLGGKIGMTSLGSRAVAEVAKPSEEVGEGQNRTQTFTYFTKIPAPGESTPVLYNGDRTWAKLRLTLETAGPVVIGTMSRLSPITSGAGIPLVTNRSTEITIAKGTRLYIAATGVNRVTVTVEPLPWLEQIFASIRALLTGRA